MEIEYEIDQNDLAAAHLFAQKQSKVYVPMAYFRIAVILIYCTWAWSFRPTSLETALEGVVFVLVSIGAVGVVLRTLNVPLERHHFIWSFKHRPELQQRCGRKTAIVAHGRANVCKRHFSESNLLVGNRSSRDRWRSNLRYRRQVFALFCAATRVR